MSMASLTVAIMQGLRGLGSRLLNDSAGSQIVEFAVALPLLVFFTVGVFDFGSAFTVKEKLAGMAHEGARIGAAQPEADLTYRSGDCTQLLAVCAVRDAVAHSLISAKLNDCGLASGAPTYAGTVASYGRRTWTFTTKGSCPANLVLTIGRAYTYTRNLNNPYDNGDDYTIEATKVTISYPYHWQFGNVVKFAAPAATFGANSQITSTAVMQNMY